MTPGNVSGLSWTSNPRRGALNHWTMAFFTPDPNHPGNSHRAEFGEKMISKLLTFCAAFILLIVCVWCDVMSIFLNIIQTSCLRSKVGSHRVKTTTFQRRTPGYFRAVEILQGISLRREIVDACERFMVFKHCWWICCMALPGGMTFSAVFSWQGRVRCSN